MPLTNTNTNIKKRMIVIDGNSLMFRAFYATNFGTLMQSRSGIYTNAIFGFINMIQGLISNYEFDNIFVAFDKGKKTLRHQAYADYKGGRKKTPEEFLMQIPYIKEYLDIMNIKHLELDDYEADDIVGTMACLAKDYFEEVLVISGDKDLLQLVKGNIVVGINRKGTTELELYTEDNFFSLMGIKSSQMVDYKALIGDNSDNLPGIPGIGPKTACDLLNTYGNIENLYDSLDELKGKTKEKIIDGKQSCYMTKSLAKLFTDVKLPYNIDDTIYLEPNYHKLRNFFEKLDFKSFLKKLPKEDLQEININNPSNNLSNNLTNKTNTETDYEIDTENIEFINIDIKQYYIDDIDNLFKCLKDANIISIDIELKEENYHHEDSILGIGIVIEDKGFFLSNEMLKSGLVSNIFDYITLNQIKIYAVDSKKLYCALKYLDIEISKFDFDLLLACYVDNPSWAQDDVKYIYEHYFKTRLELFEDIYKKRTNYDIPSIDVYSKYCLDKAWLLPAAKLKIDEKLKQNDQLDLLYKLEIPLSIVLGDMEINGFKLDEQRLKEIGNDLQKQIDEKAQAIYELCGEEFNISSPKKLGEILFDKLQLPCSKKKKNSYSTQAEVLEKLGEIHPVPRLVLEYRKYTKLYSTYVVGLIDVMNKKDHKLHTIFKQALTLTGRLSSTEPNIQNIPVRSEDGRLIRSAFIPSYENGCLISADYSQIELRILAHVSNCEKMIEAFNNGIDLHSNTAALIFNKNINDITKDERRIAKAVNFGIVYGMSSWGLSEEISIDTHQANEFIKKYFEVFKEIEEYLNNVVLDARNTLYTKTLYNRRRYMSEIVSSNFALRSFAERTAKNAPIQGTAADIIKLAMIQVHQKIKQTGLKSNLICQVHDELIIDTYPGEEEQVKKILVESMEQVVELKVKLQAELSIGKNWDMK